MAPKKLAQAKELSAAPFVNDNVYSEKGSPIDPDYKQTQCRPSPAKSDAELDKVYKCLLESYLTSVGAKAAKFTVLDAPSADDYGFVANCKGGKFVKFDLEAVTSVHGLLGIIDSRGKLKVCGVNAFQTIEGAL